MTLGAFLVSVAMFSIICYAEAGTKTDNLDIIPDEYLVTIDMNVTRGSSSSAVDVQAASQMFMDAARRLPIVLTLVRYYDFDHAVVLYIRGQNITLDDLSQLYVPAVMAIEPNYILRQPEVRRMLVKAPEVFSQPSKTTQSTCAVQYTHGKSALWGLTRISSPNSATDYASEDFHYNNLAGRGVDAYVVDSGIYTSHKDFGGRARHGYTAKGVTGGSSNTGDQKGHGTMVAGFLGSNTYGVAKDVNLIAVKTHKKSQTTATVVDALNWVYTQTRSTSRTSVVNWSASYSNCKYVSVVATAIKSLYNVNVPVVVTAGNDGKDANNCFPANMDEVITVGADDKNGKLWSGSNYGKDVDIIAPGVDVTSTTNSGGSRKSTGTSYATPHVAGAIAIFLSKCGKRVPTNGIKDLLKQNGLSHVIHSRPGTTHRRLHSTCLNPISSQLMSSYCEEPPKPTAGGSEGLPHANSVLLVSSVLLVGTMLRGQVVMYT